MVPQNDVAALKAAIAEGPVSVAIEADQAAFQFYTSGILKIADCGTKLDHAVLAVGYGANYILIKNSWGPNWGDHGFIKLETDGKVVACGAEKMPGNVVTKN
mmetsp:Transcript_84916/g.104123  ORF Transcript_84916/g.104123 Transcript_84916/m.104123 type:complete len:102 (+) Transcript_84916:645-950(+)